MEWNYYCYELLSRYKSEMFLFRTQPTTHVDLFLLAKTEKLKEVN